MKMPFCRSLSSPVRRLAASWIATLACAIPLVAPATTGIWTNNSSSSALGRWDVADSWLDSTIPDGIGDEAYFTNDITGSRTVRLNGNKTVGSLTVGDAVATSSTASAFSFTPSSASIASGNLPSMHQLVFDQTGTADALLTFPVVEAFAANNNLNCFITLNDNLIISAATTNMARVQTLNGEITDGANSYSVTKEGPGQVRVAVANTYHGGTVINGGVLDMASGSSMGFGSGPVVVNDGGQAYLDGNAASWPNDFTINGTGVAQTPQYGAMQLSGANVNGTLTIDSSARLSVLDQASFLNGALIGSSPLEINPDATNTYGPLYLNGDASGYTGTITVTGGRLHLGAASNPGGNITVADGAELGYQPTSIAGDLTLNTNAVYVDITNSSALAVAGNVTLNGPCTVNLLHAPATSPVTLMTYGGTLTGFENLDLVGGMATYRSSAFDTNTTPGSLLLTFAQGDLTWTGGENALWDYAATNWSGSSSNFYNLDNVTFDNTGLIKDITIPAPVTIGDMTLNNSAGNDYSFNGTINGGALTKSGTGMLALRGANNFTGPITLNEGTLLLTNNLVAALGSPGQDIIMNGGTMALWSSSSSIGQLYKNLVINGTGNSFTNVRFGNIQLVGNISGSGTMTINQTNITILQLVGDMSAFSGKLVLNTWIAGAPGTASGGLQMAYNNDTVTNSGSASAQFEFNGGTHYLMNNNQVGTCYLGELSGTGGAVMYAKTAKNGDVTLEVGALGTSSSFDGVLRDVASTGAGPYGFAALHLRKVGSGTLTLSGVNSHSGTTTIAEGTIALTGGGRLSGLSTSQTTPVIDVQAGATLDVSGIDPGAAGGTLTAVQTLMGNGNIVGVLTNGGTVSPGESIGTLSFSVSPALNNTVVMELNSTNSQTSDQIVVTTGPINYDGTLVLSNVGPELVAGESFTLFTAAAHTGGFASISPASPGGDLAWDLVALTNTGTLVIHSNPIANPDAVSAQLGETIMIPVATLLANDTGEDGETLSIVDVSANASLAGGEVTYTAPLSGTSDVITYTLSDGRGGVATGTINVTLTNPSYNQLSVSVLEGGDLQLTYVGDPGTNYALEVTHDLTPPVTWTGLQTNQAAGDGYLLFTNTPSLAPTNDFYRTRYEP